jgi:hypothetical protein
LGKKQVVHAVGMRDIAEMKIELVPRMVGCMRVAGPEVHTSVLLFTLWGARVFYETGEPTNKVARRGIVPGDPVHVHGHPPQ